MPVERKQIERITIDELISEVEKAQAAVSKSAVDGVSAKELAAEWGVHVETACQRLGVIAATGRLEVLKRRTINLAGVASVTPVYRIRKTSKRGKK